MNRPVRGPAGAQNRAPETLTVRAIGPIGPPFLEMDMILDPRAAPMSAA